MADKKKTTSKKAVTKKKVAKLSASELKKLRGGALRSTATATASSNWYDFCSGCSTSSVA